MVRKITDILKEKERTYSFEFYPPKTEAGRKRLPEVAASYAALKPDWFAVTYGAGGTTKEWTTDIVDSFQKRFDIPVMHHFTCVGHSQAELREILEDIKRRNICNILALRGDPPEGETEWKPAPDNFEYCYQLIQLIRSYNGFFSIGVAGFPEGHINCPDKETDSRYLKIKLDVGGEFVISQLFFDNKDYFEYLERISKIGVHVRVIPGIMPITNWQNLLRFTANCGASIPKQVEEIFKPLDGDDEASYKTGVDFIVEQCNELLKGGAPGLHFFAMNRINPVQEILSRIKR